MSSNANRTHLCSHHSDVCECSSENLLNLSRSPPPLVSSNSDERNVLCPPPYETIPGTVPLFMGASAGLPPSYEDVINPEAPPPSYQSLFGQMKEVRKNANGLIDFLKKLYNLLIRTIGCTIIIGITIVIPLSMIVIGSVYMNECPAENIPTFLLVGGIVWLFKNLMTVWSICGNRAVTTNPESETESVTQHRKQAQLLNCFLFGWFIVGCVLVYRIYEPNYIDRDSDHYCNKTVYLYSFWLVSSIFSVVGLFMACLCCLTVSTFFANAGEQMDNS